MKRLALLVPIAAVLLMGVMTARAQPADEPGAPQAGYELAWSTIAGGSAQVVGGSLSLQGTIGQAGAGAMNGGSYQLAGGFWANAALGYNVYLPLALRS